MLEKAGVRSFDDLFSVIPAGLRLTGGLDLSKAKGEQEVRSLMKKLADKNSAANLPCFLGAGAYDHFIPAAVDAVAARSEFVTAYTPYQPELSQGILQVIFEFQTIISRLTGMPLANASMYDGATALAEACLLACDTVRRRTVVLAGAINPRYVDVLRSYALSGRMDLAILPEADNGCIDSELLTSELLSAAACVVIQQPNFWGLIETGLVGLAERIHDSKAMLISLVDPMSLAVIEAPGAYGADIAVGDAQPLGLPLSFGGPYAGFFAASQALMRKIPGRLVGQTDDLDGRKAYVLTLQAREQHIRREKAGSNICSNQALCALRSVAYVGLLGRDGLTQTALRCRALALYAADALQKAGFKLMHPESQFFREFAVKMEAPEEKFTQLFASGMLGGLPIDGGMLFAFTEKRTCAEIDQMVKVLSGGEADV